MSFVVGSMDMVIVPSIDQYNVIEIKRVEEWQVRQEPLLGLCSGRIFLRVYLIVSIQYFV